MNMRVTVTPGNWIILILALIPGKLTKYIYIFYKLSFLKFVFYLH